jgi:lipoate-protein ligase A
MVNPPAQWRIIYSSAAGGAWNMAVDEAILEAIGREEVPPTLRLYAWQPPCLSLGFSQPASDIDRTRLASYGWDLVRRPTGGRAILHADELTYSVIGPAVEPRLAGSVLESYCRLAGALLDALHRLGIRAEAREKPAPVKPAEVLKQTSAGSGHKNPVCFEVPSNYEITFEGKKLIGSAQARRKEGVLQHGALPLTGDLGRITRALVFADEESRARATARLLARAATAEGILGRAPSWEEAARAFTEAFTHTLNLDLHPGVLTPSETARALELEREKYGNEEWTFKIK